MHTYQREPNEVWARSWTYRFWESGESGQICFLPLGQCRSSHLFPSSKIKQQDQHVKELATEIKVKNVLYHQAVAVGPSLSLIELDHNERPHYNDVADELEKRQDRQLYCIIGTTKTGTWHHPVAMLCPLQSRHNKFRHGEQIQSSKNRREYLLQASLQESQIEDRVLNQLAIVPTSEKVAVIVSQHMRPSRNSNKGRRTTRGSHNWPKRWQAVRGIARETIWHGHGNPTKSVLLPRSYEGPQCHTTPLEFQTVQMVSLSLTNYAWQSSG